MNKEVNGAQGKREIKQGDIEEMIHKAFEAREKAYTPYSGFMVGAALRTADGNIYTGCNVENAAYAPTNCAERTAFFKAVSEGERHFSAIAVVGGSAGTKEGEFEYVTPCGVCRQVMAEFCAEDFLIVTAKHAGDYRSYSLKELLPEAFGPGDLNR